jgi:O-antigen/teichoic acid export membrane protein
LFLLFSGFHSALVLEPLSVFAPRKHGAEAGAYLRSVLLLNTACALAMAALLGAMAPLVADGALAIALIAAATATPFILTFWFVRRSAYAMLRPELALRGSTAYGPILIFGLLGLGFFNLLSIPSAFGAMALASLVACLVALPHRRPASRFSDDRQSLADTLRNHWNYGRWIAAASVVHWLSGPAYIPLLGAASSVENSGAFRAAQNLVLPMQHALVGMGLYLLPLLARRRARGDLNVMRTVPGLILALGGAGLLYSALLLAFAPRLIDLFYGAGNFETALSVIPYFAAGLLVHGISAPLALALRAVERPAALFRAHAAGSLVTATAGAYLVSSRGLVGAAEGSLLASLVTAGAMALSVRSLARGRS